MKFRQFLQLRELALAHLTAETTAVGEQSMQAYAFLGDALYAAFVRRRLLATGITGTRVLHSLAAEIVSARNQSRVLLALAEQLTPEEREICRRARNAQVTTPASAGPDEYRRSTAWEALLGYLHCAGREERLAELLAAGLTAAVEVMRNETK